MLAMLLDLQDKYSMLRLVNSYFVFYGVSYASFTISVISYNTRCTHELFQRLLSFDAIRLETGLETMFRSVKYRDARKQQN